MIPTGAKIAIGVGIGGLILYALTRKASAATAPASLPAPAPGPLPQPQPLPSSNQQPYAKPDPFDKLGPFRVAITKEEEDWLRSLGQ